MKSVFVSVQPRNADFFLQGSGLRPHNISIILPLEKEPMPRRAGANAAVGGAGASIAQMYICTACWGKPQSPMPPASGSNAAAPQEGAEMAEIEKRHHLHIVLTPRQYRLLCSQAKQCRLTKRAYPTKLLSADPRHFRPALPGAWPVRYHGGRVCQSHQLCGMAAAVQRAAHISFHAGGGYADGYSGCQ